MAAPSTVLSHPAGLVRDRSSLFHSFLADQPEYLVPERLIASDGDSKSAGPLVVSTNVWFTWRDHLPPCVQACYPMPDKFLANTGLIWVDDPVSRVQRPFWVGPWFQEKLARLERGRPAAGLSSHHCQVLFQAGVLTRSGESGRLTGERRVNFKTAADKFEAEGYTCLHELIHPFHLGSLRRYYRHLVRTGGMSLGDNSSPLRYVAYNESVAQFFHLQLTTLVSEVAGTQVKPSFVYVVAYQGNADLPVHTDRQQCEYAVSLLVDYTPEPFDQSSWPLYFETAKGTCCVWQALGDAVLYRGRSLPHFRKQLSATSTSTSILFYYVNHDFSGSLA